MDEPEPKGRYLKMILRIRKPVTNLLLVAFVFSFSVVPEASAAWCPGPIRRLGESIARARSGNTSDVKRLTRMHKLLQSLYPLNYRTISNPLPQIANLKFFDLKDPIEVLRVYIDALTEGESPDVNPGERADYYYIIDEARHLKTHNLFQKENGEREFAGLEDPHTGHKREVTDITVDDVFDTLVQKRLEYLRLLRLNPEVQVLHPAAERVLKGAKGAARWVGNTFGIGTAIAVATALMAGYMLFFNAWAQQASFQFRHWLQAGGNGSVVVSDGLNADIDEYAVVHQATWNFMRSNVRDDGIHIPGSIAAINTALDNARFLHHDAELEKYWVRILYDIDLIVGDFTGVTMGHSTRDLINHLYSIYDGDGSIRREFIALKNKSELTQQNK